MERKKLFYEILSEVSPIGARANTRPAVGLPDTKTAKVGQDPLPAAVVSKLPVCIGNLYRDTYPIPSTFYPPHLDKEVEPGVFWTGRLGYCECCRKRTEYVIYVPEMAYICSKECNEKFNL